LDPAIVNTVSAALLLFIGWLDYITGYEFGFFVFYFIPVSISAWLGTERSGLAIACASRFVGSSPTTSAITPTPMPTSSIGRCSCAWSPF